jgi:hypothetical protein
VFQYSLVADKEKIMLYYGSTLRAITQCKVQSRQNTFFWLDRWLLPESLANIHPAISLHHLINPNAFVSEILEEGLSNGLRNRLTNVATAELTSLLFLLQDLQLTDHLLLPYPNTWSLQSTNALPHSVWPSILLSMLWCIWDVRIALIFRGCHDVAISLLSL